MRLPFLQRRAAPHTQREVVGSAVIAGLLAGLAFTLIANEFAPMSRILLSWDVGVLTYLIGLWRMFGAADTHDFMTLARNAGSGRHFVMIVSVLAVIASLALMAFEIHIGRMEDMAHQGIRVAFVMVTVVLSWLFMHASLACHYIYEYYRANGHGAIRRGLDFPSRANTDYWPDFWDMLHFAFCVGVTLATADVDITSRSIRRIVTVHSIGSFLFNTLILAATINFAAEVIRPGGS